MVLKQFIYYGTLLVLVGAFAYFYIKGYQKFPLNSMLKITFLVQIILFILFFSSLLDKLLPHNLFGSLLFDTLWFSSAAFGILGVIQGIKNKSRFVWLIFPTTVVLILFMFPILLLTWM